MSLFGSLTTAVSGLGAQSKALGFISDNVANSQTVGFKKVEANFTDYLTESSSTVSQPGAVTATPQYSNSVQGTVQQSDNPLALAVTGPGFFPVQRENGVLANGTPTFDSKQYYTRAGDFHVDKNGYVANGGGYTLQGWPIMASGLPDQTQTVPVQISNTVFNPVPTSAINLSANLPATPTSPTTSTQVMIYDSLGNQQAIDLNWTRNSQDNWTLQIDAPGDIALQNRGSVDLVFGTTSGNPVAAGTIGLLNNQTGSVTPTAFSSGGDSSFTFTADFGAGAQTITLDLGSFGSSNGVTQFAGTDYNIRNATQDGVPPGAYSSLSMKPNGDVVVNYDNGQTKTIARVPLANFRDADKLQREDGQAFTQTLESGTATLNQSNSNGAGQIVTGSLEASNVDIASEFTKLIVAQRAYSANAKIVTTADDMLQETMSMKR